MKTITKRTVEALFTLLLMSITTACNHKELCHAHDEHALKYQTNILAEYEKEWHQLHEGGTDWKNNWPDNFSVDYEELRPGIPDGLRVQIYKDDKNINMVNLPATGGIINLQEGEHSLLFYNNNTEYILFHDLQSYFTARATTRTRSRSTYLGNQYVDTKNENTVNPPDILYGNYIDSHIPKKLEEPEDLPVTMHPLVFTYLVRYEFSHGLKYVSLARGALAGMAAEVYLNTAITSEEPATVLFDCTVEDYGAQAIVNSFGAPGFPNDNYTKGPRQYGLNLEVKLKNGKMVNFDFDVSDQLEKQPHGGVIIVKGIEIDDETGQEGSSGFDPDVDDWGDYTDVELPL